MSEEIKEYKPKSSDPVNFETKEEFQRFYSKNKDEIDKMSTRTINKKFIINGYKIGRSKNELTFFSKQTPMGKRLGSINEGTEEQTQVDTDMLEIKIDNIYERLQMVEKYVSAICKMLMEQK